MWKVVGVVFNVWHGLTEFPEVDPDKSIIKNNQI